MLTIISTQNAQKLEGVVITSHSAKLSKAVKNYLVKRGIINGRIDIKPKRHNDPVKNSVSFYLDQNEQVE